MKIQFSRDFPWSQKIIPTKYLNWPIRESLLSPKLNYRLLAMAKVYPREPAILPANLTEVKPIKYVE